jgi:hypothetical protein
MDVTAVVKKPSLSGWFTSPHLTTVDDIKYHHRIISRLGIMAIANMALVARLD